MFTLELVYFL